MSTPRTILRASVALAAAGAVALGTAGVASAATTSNGFNPLATRILDTRSGLGDGVPGAVSGLVQVTLPDTVPNGSVASLSVTATQEAGPGYVSVYSDGQDAPPTSNLNYVTGVTVTQTALVEPGDAGVVDFNVAGGAIQLIVDVLGYFPSTSYAALPSPMRVVDTRHPGTPAPRTGQVPVPLGANVPPGATAVALQLTQASATATGYLAINPAASADSTTSVLNYSAGTVRTNLVIVKLTGSTPRPVINIVGGATQVIVDVMGYVPNGSAVTPLAYSRVADTRHGVGRPAGAVAGTVTFTLPSALVPNSVTSVIIDVTAIGAGKAGYVGVPPLSTGDRQTSSVAVPATGPVNGLLIAPVDNGVLTLVVGGGPVNLAIDLAGTIANVAGN